MGESARGRDVDALWQRSMPMQSMQDNIWAMGQRQTLLAAGSVGVTILVGGTADVSVTWPVPVVTDTYSVDVILLDLLGKATATVLSQDPNGAVIRVTAGLLVTAGAQFLALARS